MTLQQFLAKYLGKIKGYPDDSQYLGQCLSIVKLYIKECFGINPPPSGTNSAYGYWSNFPNPLGTVFEKVEKTPDLIPQEGWIAIWKPWTSNIYGHIAIVASGSTTGTFKNYAQNWTSKVFQLESNRYTNVIGFLKPKEDNMITDEQKRILDFIGDRSEGDVREAFGALADIQNLKEKVVALEKLSDDLKNRVGELEDKLSENEVSIADYQKQVTSANKLIANQKEEIEVLTKERADYKKWYETALNKAADKLTSWELLQLLIKKLQWWKK